jgi:hypothetical protein
LIGASLERKIQTSVKITRLPDFRILIGTDQGDIIIAEGDGTFKMNLFQEHPIDGFYINSLKTYMKGFLVGGNRG